MANEPPLRLEWRTPQELAENPRNWRTHPQSQLQALTDIVGEVGWAGACLFNERTQRLIDGHARRKIALEQGTEKVPVLVGSWTEEQEAKILATLDPLAAMAGADAAALDRLLADVHTSSPALNQMLEELQEAAQKAVELPETGGGGDDFDATPEETGPTRTAVGELWVIGGKHRLLVGDCTDAGNVVILMNGKLASLVYTDPPYGVDYDGGTKVREKLAGDATTDLYGPACQMAYQFSDDKSPIYLWHAGVKGIAAAAAAAAAAAGYEIRCEIVWNKNQAQFGALSAQYKQKHEPAYYCFKVGHPPRWFGPTNEVTVWDCKRASVNEFHPTQKPVELAERAISNSSEQGQIVLDLFLGSGATLIAAHRLNRICYGCEIEPRYADVILKRAEAEGLTCERDNG